MAGKFSRRAIRFGLLAIVVLVLVAAAVYLLSPGAPTQPPLPNPNGYDDLVRAGKMLGGDLPDLQSADVDQLRGYVERNAAAFKLARLGLTRQCRVPVENTQQYLTVATPRWQAMRELSRAFAVEAKLAEQEGRASDASRCYVDLITLAQAGSRGGLLLHMLGSVAIEDMGIQGLWALREKLSASERGKLAQSIAQMDRNWEPFAAISAREKAWSRNAVPWYARLAAGSSVRTTLEKGAKALERSQARRRLLVSELTVGLEAPRGESQQP